MADEHNHHALSPEAPVADLGNSKKHTNDEQLQDAESTRVAVVGGGLVGSMMACFLARRGFQVDVFEYRSDPRNAAVVIGKSINLALSERGRTALRSLGLEQQILDEYSIKMYARMIHNLDGTCKTIPYGNPDQCILSVSRRFLNELLLTEAEKYKNASVHFKHKLVEADLTRGELVFESQINNNLKDHETFQADVVLGCDGAYSAVRQRMLKLLMLNYSQHYIEHGYLELCIPPNADGGFAMACNYLHIWPRGKFMMIALPNLDCSFTVTLFMPFAIFAQLDTKCKLLHFFETHFPDSIPLLTKDGLVDTYFANKPQPLISIKCAPYNYKDKVLLMGDAAHAMVPFYGQGMNCGFEDCVVLDELLEQFGSKQLGSCLERCSKARVDNCHAIIDLAMYNYIEMRDLVNRKTFLVRKWFDNCMFSVFPRQWQPLYTMVTFSRTPYRKCLADRHWQDQALTWAFKLAALLFTVSIFLWVFRGINKIDTEL